VRLYSKINLKQSRHYFQNHKPAD